MQPSAAAFCRGACVTARVPNMVTRDAAIAGAPYDVVLSGARIDATLDSEGDFKLERLMAAARPLGNRALPTQSLPPTTAASGARRALCQ